MADFQIWILYQDMFGPCLLAVLSMFCLPKLEGVVRLLGVDNRLLQDGLRKWKCCGIESSPSKHPCQCPSHFQSSPNLCRLLNSPHATWRFFRRAGATWGSLLIQIKVSRCFFCHSFRKNSAMWSIKQKCFFSMCVDRIIVHGEICL